MKIELIEEEVATLSRPLREGDDESVYDFIESEIENYLEADIEPHYLLEFYRHIVSEIDNSLDDLGRYVDDRLIAKIVLKIAGNTEFSIDDLID